MSKLTRRLWERWKRFGKRVGDFQARLLLSVFYYLIFAPFALVVRWVCDPLAIKPDTEKRWRFREESESPATERANKQF